MLFSCLLIIQYSCSPAVSYFDGWTLWKERVLTAPCFPWEELHCSRQAVLQEATARSGIRHFFPPLLQLSDHFSLNLFCCNTFLSFNSVLRLRMRMLNQGKANPTKQGRRQLMLEVWCWTQKLVSHCAFVHLTGCVYVYATQIIYSIFCHQVSMISSFCCWTSTACTPPSFRSSTSVLLPLREEQPTHARKLRCVGGTAGCDRMGMFMYFAHALNFHDYRRMKMRFPSCRIRVWRWAFFPKKFENWWSADDRSNS